MQPGPVAATAALAGQFFGPSIQQGGQALANLFGPSAPSGAQNIDISGASQPLTIGNAVVP